MKKVLCSIMAVFMVFLTVPAATIGTVSAATTVNAKSVKINKTSITLQQGKTYTLKATVSPTTTTKKTVTWSSNSSVASVNKNGKVTAKKPGVATITAKTTNGKNATSKVTVKLATPSVKAASKTATSVTISWNKVPYAKSYQVYRATSKNGKYKAIKSTKSSSYTNSGLKAGSTYYYKVRAKYSSSKYDSAVSAAVKAKAAPATPSVSVSSTTSSVTLKWKKVSSATGYQVYRATSAKGSYKKLTTLSSSKTSYKNSKLSSGKTYYYRVRAYQKVGKKTYYSSYQTITVSTLPAKITGLKGSKTYSSVTLKWSKNSTATGYQVYRATSKNGSYKKVATIKKNSTVSYTDKAVNPSTTYYYKVRAYRTVSNKNYYGSCSSVLNVKTSAVPKPATVAGLKSSATASSVTLKWNKISSVTGYQVYRATSVNGTYQKVATITKNSTVSYTDKTVKPKTTYYYKVRAYFTYKSKNYYGNDSSALKATTPALPVVESPTTPEESTKPNDPVSPQLPEEPAAPAKVSMNTPETTSNSVTLKWNKIADASGYEVYRSSSSNGSYTMITSINNAETVSYTDKAVNSSTTYYYKVRAYKTENTGNIYGDYSDVISSTTLATPTLSTVTGLTATSAADAITLQWDSTTDVTGYEVYRSGVENGDFSLIGTINDGSSVSYTDTELIPETTYYYKVRAYKTESTGNIYGDYSDVISSTTLATPTLSTVTGLMATAAADAITLQWDSTTDVTGYEVYRSGVENGDFSLIGTINDGSSVSYTDTELTPETTYYYKVRAYKTENTGNIYGDYSDVISSTTLATPTLSTVTGLTALATADTVTLAWVSNPNVTGYEVYRSINENEDYSLIKTIYGSSSVSYTDSNVEPTTTYYYKVRGFKASETDNQYSDLTDAVSVTTQESLRPEAVSDLEFTGSENGIAFAWDNVPNATGYEIFRTTTEGNAYEMIATLDSSADEYTDSTASGDYIFTYQVRAYRIVDGESYYGKFSPVLAVINFIPSIPEEFPDEYEPSFDYVERTICNGCGADITGDGGAHTEAAALAGNEACRSYSIKWIAIQSSETTEEEF